MRSKQVYFSCLILLCLASGLVGCSTPVRTISSDNSLQPPKKIFVVGIGIMKEKGDKLSSVFDATLIAELGKCGIKEESIYKPMKPQTLSLTYNDEEKDFRDLEAQKRIAFQPDALLEVTLTSTTANQSALSGMDIRTAGYDIHLSDTRSEKVIWHGFANGGERKSLAINIVKRMRESGVLSDCPDDTGGKP